MKSPFEIVGCSWPRPVEQADGRWASEPEWGTPLMPVWPLPHWETIDGEPCWIINWREFFKTGTKPYDHTLGGEMRGFHVVFHLRVKGSGKLAFWADDGCVISQNGEVVHSDRGAHPPTRGELDVVSGDWLQVAQWQRRGEWLWGARLLEESQQTRSIAPADLLQPYLGMVQEALGRSDGPPLKMYLGGQSPVRTIIALYSMVLNGYAPSRVILFGEHQWSKQARELFAATLPFAELVSTDQLMKHVGSIGGSRLIDMAQQYWWVMKALITLLWPPEESCVMDDDVFILDRTDDALEAFERCDLVFSPDQYNWGEGYLERWGPVIDGGLLTLPTTGMFNGGLFWIRHFTEPREIADLILRSEPDVPSPFLYGQGLIATLYAHKNTHQLPTQRYFLPLCEGLPGGLVGYDYASNPCGFTSVHFAGLLEKPSDSVALELAPRILARKPEHQICPYPVATVE